MRRACEGGAEPVGVVTLVGQKLLGFRHGGQHQRGALVVAHGALVTGFAKTLETSELEARVAALESRRKAK